MDQLLQSAGNVQTWASRFLGKAGVDDVENAGRQEFGRFGTAKASVSWEQRSQLTVVTCLKGGARDLLRRHAL
jgi:hypothetical protein